ncbi:hypothetical protein TWF481_001373 [Arthrobotrys musiformis]|uniref:CFEM domain-containing protein n=1 Tax=Arthrobotrys musiformis TaxID=47236 RepID=A0AAV9WS13_9PEZI
MQHITTHLLLLLLTSWVAAINDTKIDFSTAPSCALPDCLDSNTPYTWTPQNLCPSTTSILPSCFCNLPRPLICLPYDPTVSNPCYTPLKRWYNALCLSTMGITPNHTLQYLKLPSCARTCAMEMTTHLGCPDHSLNCACQLTYLPSNVADCISDRCVRDIKTYIGDLQIFTGKWIYQACSFDEDSNTTTLGIRSDSAEYVNSPSANPQVVLVDDFQGEEYTEWQDALNAKRARNSNLGVIIPLSLVFGGVFGVIGLQWLAACCGFTTPAGRRRWSSAGRGVMKVVSAVGSGVAWFGKGVARVGQWVWRVGKGAVRWVKK